MLRGCLDRATWNSLDGWAHDPETPEAAVELEVLDDDEPIARFTANRYRADLVKVGRDGRCSFSLRLPLGWSGMTERRITVRRVSDGAILPGSPCTPELPGDAAARMRQSVTQLVRAATTDGVAREPAEHDGLLRLLADTADRILRARLERGRPDAIDVEAFYARWRPLLSDPTVPCSASRRTARPRCASGRYSSTTPCRIPAAPSPRRRWWTTWSRSAGSASRWPSSRRTCGTTRPQRPRSRNSA